VDSDEEARKQHFRCFVLPVVLIVLIVLVVVEVLDLGYWTGQLVGLAIAFVAAMMFRLALRVLRR
jgi:hypothetical protein